VAQIAETMTGVIAALGLATDRAED
jgi:hypothetical protein